MKRIRYSEGQLVLQFSEAPIPEIEQIISTPADVFPIMKVPRKPRVKHIEDYDYPSVTLHKAGKKVLVKPNDIYAADVYRELKDRFSTVSLREASYYSPNTGAANNLPIFTYEYLDVSKPDKILDAPLLTILRSYGIQVHISDTLRNYMKIEARREKLESTPFPSIAAESDARLLDRCCEGTILECIKDYSQDSKTFKAGMRYLVVSIGGESRDSIGISSVPAGMDKITTPADVLEWTNFSPEMEEYFSDSKSHVEEPTVDQLYPQRVEEMRKRLAKLNFPLFDHVATDVVMAALYRGWINAYPMRFGKSSSAIAWAVLRGHTKIAFVGPRNARIAVAEEFKRMGFKENEDYILVDRLADINKKARFYLIKSTWLWRPAKHPKLGPRIDREENNRREGKGIFRIFQMREEEDATGKVVSVPTLISTPCPHCGEALQRLEQINDAALLKEASKLVTFKYPDGSRRYFIWTTERGYKCLNQECKYTTKSLGGKRGNTHKGGYIDYELLKHAECGLTKVRGRMCKKCMQADGIWAPGQYKRIKKAFTAVIADEVHDNKDHKTLRARALYSLRARARAGLTGTLVGNSAMDTYWPFHWATGGPNTRFPYGGVAGMKQFDARFCAFASLEKPIGEEVGPDGKIVKIIKIVKKRIPFLKDPPDWWRFISDKMLRRTYEDPMFKASLERSGRYMPTADIHRYPCPMDRQQATIMLAALQDFKTTFAKMIETVKTKNQELNPSIIIAQMATLRSIATCPEVLNIKIGPGTYTGQPGGGKMEHVDYLAKAVVENGGKFLVLSDLQQMQKTVEQYLKTKFRVVRFDTSWDDDKRRDIFEWFKSSEADGMVAGTRAISEGLDLSAEGNCNTVICTDMLWSPVKQRQAWSRAMTPSTNNRVVKVYLLTSNNSIDEHVYNVFYSKLVAAEQALDKKTVSQRTRSFDVKWFVDRVIEEETAISNFLENMQEGSASKTMEVVMEDAEELFGDRSDD